MADKVIIYGPNGRAIFVGTDDPPPKPLTQPIMSNGEAVTLAGIQNVDIISGSQFAYFQPDFTGTAMIRLSVNTSGVSGQLSLNESTIGGTQVNSTSVLLDGISICSGDRKEIPISIERKVVYSLSFSAVCNVTVAVVGQPTIIADGQSTVNLTAETIEIGAVQVQNTAGAVINPAQDGTDGNGITAPASGTGSGAIGIRGWLSLLYGWVSGQLSTLSPKVTATLSGSITEVQATLQNDGSGHYYTSAAINLTNIEILRIMMPATWTAAVISFQTSDAQAGTFQPLYDDAGNEIQITVAAARNIACVNNAIACAGFGWVKINSGSNSALVDQTAARVISILGKM